MVVIRAFSANGSGSYADVIQGIDWIVRKKSTYNIRVLNCSFSAPVRSHYWEDPINHALMKAWRAGIVVVASAGNSGPSPMSVGVPGNNPYVITVGAMTDNYTPTTAGDDRLASFSSTGPTYEGFVKPDLVAPGGHMVALTRKESWLTTQYRQFYVVDDFFQMSGTSQAAAVVSGAAALVLQKNPSFTPDQVKCALVATARPAMNPVTNGQAYTVFQPGAGIVDAYAASHGTMTDCANGGMSIDRDLAGAEHYGGPASQDAAANYYVIGEVGSHYSWDGSYSRGSGYPWSWSTGLAEPASTNAWVPQE